MLRIRRVLRMAALASLTAFPAYALDPAAPWSDTPMTRIEALALLQTLNAELLSNDSATLTLERWCSAHRMAEPPLVRAERVRDEERPAPPEVRARLKVGDGDEVRHRRVRLRCGAVLLSEADNWYVPARLTPEMNRILDSSDTPFGKAVRALNFRRRTLAAEVLWQPLPAGWEMAPALPPVAAGPLDMPRFVLQHRAVLEMPDGTPFSALEETYTRGVLAFPVPPQR